jgi:nitrogen fixation protein NifQ
MKAEEAYEWLISASAASLCDDFDVHVVAAIFALAMGDAASGERSIADGTGLDGAAMAELIAEMFPGGASELLEATDGATVTVDAEEQSLRDILGMFATGASRLETHLTAMIARRCKWPHHLWQDLGLRTRGELSELMQRHFARLAAKNSHDMKWKKFLYRMVCGSEGFTLCTSPVCSECSDFSDCFGAEDGESRLAWARNAPDAAA